MPSTAKWLLTSATKGKCICWFRESTSKIKSCSVSRCTFLDIFSTLEDVLQTRNLYMVFRDQPPFYEWLTSILCWYWIYYHDLIISKEYLDNILNYVILKKMMIKIIIYNISGHQDPFGWFSREMYRSKFRFRPESYVYINSQFCNS